MNITMNNFTNTPAPRGAPANQFVHERVFPPPSFKQVVRLNVDTLYSSAFLDLTKEPIVMSVPETHGRYYLLPLMDAWTNVFATPGLRTRGDAAANFLIAGPNWTGNAPAGMQILKSPTNMAWLLGRTETHGPADYAAVHVIQDGYKLTPLSRIATAYTPPAAVLDSNYDAKTPPVEKLKAMSAIQYFDELAQLLKANPPPEADAPVIAKLARIGIVPGKPFDPAQLDPAVAKGLEGSVSLAMQKLQTGVTQMGATAANRVTNGWRVPPMTLGNYGTNYRLRAIITLVAFGANLPADAVYPTTFVDGDGNALDGSHRYLLHFGAAPPVNAFWSVTMYGPDSFFVANAINRQAISSWMPLKYGSDGSLDVYIQKDSPSEEHKANWLPAPDGHFNLTLRMYWPKDRSPSILDGSWVPPAVMKVDP
jgi:hypothetical protein